MNIETLRIFCDVVQHQSFSRGAKINDVSQSAATQSVHRVEEHFGVQLVDRSKRPFVLTPEGQACYEGFREVLELYDSVEARVRSLRMEISGLVRVAAIYSVGLHDMSRCMQDFMRQYPKAKVRLEYLRPNKVYEAVLNAEVDLGIISYPAASPDLDVIPLRSERMVVVCPPGHPLDPAPGGHGRAPPGRWTSSAFDRDLSIRKEIDRYLRQRSINIRVVMEFDNIETIKQAVEIGAGVSILPEPTVRDEVARRHVGGGPADRARVVPADRHHPPPAARCSRPPRRSSSSCCKQVQNQPPEEHVMRDPEVLVRFRPSGREAYVLPGTRLVEAAAEAGLVLDVPCGGEGLCGKCRVIVASGAGEPTAAERQWLSAEELRGGLAAGLPVGGARADGGRDSARRRWPPRNTRFSSMPAGAARPADDPPVRKRYVELPPPTPRRRPARRAAAGAGVGRPGRWKSTCRCCARFPPGCARPTSAARPCWPAAVCWTSSRATPRPTPSPWPSTSAPPRWSATLLDLGTGSEWAVDVAAESADPLRRRRALADPPRPAKPRRPAAVARGDPLGRRRDDRRVVPAGGHRRASGSTKLTFAGNTTMQQLLCGVDPSPLGEVPFVPAGGRGLACLAAELGLHIHPRGGGYVMPVIGGFVGGDTVAGILATGLADVRRARACWSTSAPTARSCCWPTASSRRPRPRPGRPSRAHGSPAACAAAPARSKRSSSTAACGST